MTYLKTEFTILIDTREQRPYDFRSVSSVTLPWNTERASLSTGDYSVARYDHEIVGERKSLTDLYGTVTRGRKRFEAELERMRGFVYPFIVIEATLAQIMDPNTYLRKKTKANPRSIVMSLLTWSQRYGVHLFWCEGRDIAEQLTFRILERWVIDSRTGRRDTDGRYTPFN